MSRMLEEIRQQPEALERTLLGEARRVESLKRLLEKNRPRLIVLAARGTSDNAALFGRYLLEISTGIPVSLAAPSISTLYRRQGGLSRTLLVALSQSGESTDTNLVLERARAARRTHPGDHQRARQHAGAPGRARLPGARRQGKERGRHQDLHRPDAAAVPAGLRAGRAVQLERLGAHARRGGRRAASGTRDRRRSPSATASCATPRWWGAG